MAGFPLTAWALRHPWGDDADTVFDRLRGSARAAEESEPRPAAVLLGELLEELEPAWDRACSRWGNSRVAMILGTAEPSTNRTVDPLSAMARERTGIAGAVYQRLCTGAGGPKALASAHRLLRASLADAVLVAGIDDDRGSLLLIERHGDAFVELRASAEATGRVADALDEASASRVVSLAWAATDRAPLGYVHTQTPSSHADATAERRAVQAVLGPVPCCSTRAERSAPAIGSGATDAVLTAVSLVRGFAPQTPAHELEHDRVLLHSFSPTAQHVALLLQARA